MILSTRDVRWLFSVFSILLAFLGFLKSFSSVMTQVWLSACLRPLAFILRTPDLVIRLSDRRTMPVCWLFVQSLVKNSLPVGPALRGLERYGKHLAIVMTAILFDLFHAKFWSKLFSKVSLAQFWGYIALEYNIWWAIFITFLNNFAISQGLHYVTYHVDEGLVNWLNCVLVIGSIVMIVVLRLNGQLSRLIFKLINLNWSFPVPASFWFWFFVPFTILMSIVPYGFRSPVMVNFKV